MRRATAVVVLGILIGLLPSASAGAAPARIQKEPVRWHMQSGHEHGSPVGAGATAKLVRTSRGLSYSVKTNQLDPGHAYTLWIVVINDPGSCSQTPCSPVDILLTAETDAQITYGTGHVVGHSGEAGFGGTLRRGPIPTGWLLDQGLDDPLGAQVHFVLNDHGPMLPEFMPEMIQTYRAGCTDESLPPIFPDSAKADGTPGPNTCRLFQLAVFQ
jgi:hypothetical protein